MKNHQHFTKAMVEEVTVTNYQKEIKERRIGSLGFLFETKSCFQIFREYFLGLLPMVRDCELRCSSNKNYRCKISRLNNLQTMH